MRQKGSAGEYEWTRAAYDEIRDCEKHYHCLVLIRLEPSHQKGVWNLSLVAADEHSPSGTMCWCRYEASWPNSQVVSFGAFLYQCSHRLARMVEAHALDVQKAEATKQK